MRPFSEFSLPIKGLGLGNHQFTFELDEKFFSNFEDSPISKSELSATVDLDRRTDMLIFDCQIVGWVATNCDRCTAEIELEVADERQLIIKLSDEKEADDDEVVFLPRDASEFNLAEFLYECSVMALPIIKTYDCENDDNPPCDFEILGKIAKESDLHDEPNPAWEALKSIGNLN